LFALVLGAIAILLSIIETDLLGVVILANSFYYPIVSPPFLFAIFGFRSSTKSVLIGMCAGFIATVLCKIFPVKFASISQKIVGLYFAMLCNTVFLIGSHYILKQPGGWVGSKTSEQYKVQNTSKQSYISSLIGLLQTFNMDKYLRKIAPSSEMTYMMLGIYFIIYTFTTMYSTHVELLKENNNLIFVIYQIMMVTSTLIAMYPIWPLSIKTETKQSIIRAWWPLSIFYMLIFFSCFFVMVSDFSMLQSAVFVINLMVAAFLLGWRLAVILIPFGFYMSINFHQHYFAEYNVRISFDSPEFILIYVVMLVGTTLLIFLKPKQEYVEATEAKVDYLSEENTTLTYKVDDYGDKLQLQEKEIARLGKTAQRILNNVNHELRLPVGNVINFAEMLSEGLGKYTKKQLKELSDEVVQNSNRLSSMILNMLDLATLDAKKIELNKQTVNVSEMISDRAQHCFKLYKDNKPLQFRLVIEPEILAKVDPNYIRQTVDNLVINAINYSQEGTITVTLRKNTNQVIFTISDEGLGIPQNELLTIFEPFQQSSKTTSKAEGRGVGLALCKAAVEAHGGVISAESKGSGARFRFVLPL
jgi:signal transduction histidine kinase